MELFLGRRFEEDIMAIYWSEYTQGTVHQMSYDANNGQIPSSINRRDIEDIEKGLVDAFSPAAEVYFRNNGRNIKIRTIGKIVKAYAFTWNNMINGQPGPKVSISTDFLMAFFMVQKKQKKIKNCVTFRHIFQATLVQTDNGLWFLQIYYGPLARGQVKSTHYEEGQKCRHAEVKCFLLFYLVR